MSLQRIDDLLATGEINNIVIGRSAVPGKNRFVTLRADGAKAVASGGGDTVQEAFDSAMSRYYELRGPITKLPGM